MNVWKGIGKFLLRIVIVALGIVALGWLCWFVFDLIEIVSVWMTKCLEGAWDLLKSNWVYGLLVAILATVVWTVVEVIDKHIPKKSK